MTILAASHAASLHRAVGTPAVAVHNGAALIVGRGIQRFQPGSGVTDLVGEGHGVPMEPGVSIRADVLALYGGHPEGDEQGALATIEERSAITGAVLAPATPRSLPFLRRGVCVVRRGRNDVGFGGSGSDGFRTEDIWVSRDGGPPRVLRFPMAAVGSYLSAGIMGGSVFLLGSGLRSWLPPKPYFDIVATIDEDGPRVDLVPAITGTSLFGTATAQLPDGAGFLSFGGFNSSVGTSCELWHHSAAGSRLLGEVHLDGEPWRVAYAGAMWSASESAVFLIGGTRNPTQAPNTAEGRIIRVPVTL